MRIAPCSAGDSEGGRSRQGRSKLPLAVYGGGLVGVAGSKRSLGAGCAALSPCRSGSAPGDARGEAPCIRKLKNLPLPAGKGAGGWGQEQS